MAACRHGKSAARSGVDSVAPVLKSRDAAAQPTAGAYLVPLSARTDEALRAMAQDLTDRLATDDPPALADVASTLATGRAHLQRRLALIVDTSADLQRGLRAIAAGQPSGGAGRGPGDTGARA